LDTSFIFLEKGVGKIESFSTKNYSNVRRHQFSADRTETAMRFKAMTNNASFAETD